MLRFILLGLLLSPSALAAESAPQVIRRFALIAGTNDGGDGRVRLRYATTDARAVSRVLEELGGVAPSDQLLLLEADRDDLEAGIDELRRRMERGKGEAGRVELLVYYSGHSDEEGLLLQGDKLTYRDLRRRLDTLPADVRIAILDSCSSGALTRKKGGKVRPPFLVDESAKVRGHAFLTSSSEHEAAQESDRIGASFFTHYLLSGLRGAADVTADGRVTLNEAYQFAYAETLQRTEKTQSGPQHAAYDIQLAGTGDLVMTDLRSTSAGLMIAEDVGGRLYVRDHDRHLVAELYKPAGRVVELGLAAGDYEVTLEQQGTLFSASLTLVDGKRTTLGARSLTETPRELTAMRGDLVPQEPIGGHVLRTPEGVEVSVLPATVGIIPGVSFPGGAPQAAHTFGFNLLYGEAAQLLGLQLGFGVNWVRGDTRGGQLALGLNHAGADLHGVQIAVGGNIAAGSATGVQSAVGFNWTEGDMTGGQMATGLNVAEKSLAGFQTSAGVNYLGGDLRGFQVTSGGNVTRGAATGVQVAAGLNYAGSLQGLQVAVLNIAGDTSGGQVGVINIAGKVSGVQVGVVNISDEVDAPIGLFNWVTNGERHLDVWTTSTEPYNLSLKLGGKYFYSMWSVHALRPRLDAARDIKWSPSLGFGGHARLADVYLDVDVSAGGILSGGDTYENLLTRARAVLGYRFAEHFALFAGAAYNVYLGFEGRDDEKISDSPWLGLGEDVEREGDVTIRRWPSIVVGISI